MVVVLTAMHVLCGCCCKGHNKWNVQRSVVVVDTVAVVIVGVVE